MSHSPLRARWRWMNWLRCSSADSGNLSSFAASPFASLLRLNYLVVSVLEPDTSMPAQ